MILRQMIAVVAWLISIGSLIVAFVALGNTPGADLTNSGITQFAILATACATAIHYLLQPKGARRRYR